MFAIQLKSKVVSFHRTTAEVFEFRLESFFFSGTKWTGHGMPYRKQGKRCVAFSTRFRFSSRAGWLPYSSRQRRPQEAAKESKNFKVALLSENFSHPFSETKFTQTVFFLCHTNIVKQVLNSG